VADCRKLNPDGETLIHRNQHGLETDVGFFISRTGPPQFPAKQISESSSAAGGFPGFCRTGAGHL
jgi:hypothetical protein